MFLSSSVVVFPDDQNLNNFAKLRCLAHILENGSNLFDILEHNIIASLEINFYDWTLQELFRPLSSV